jgi:hypothetical protein
MQRAFYLLGWGYVAICCALILRERRAPEPARLRTAPGAAAPVAFDPTDAVQWFRRVKPYCNSVEVGLVPAQVAPPATVRGAGYHAACFALAGRIDDARRIIDRLAPADRHRAAGIVFDVGHPVADAGDDRAAGPIMELVIDYWPNHYMALYHAGMAEYMLGQYDLATRNLEQFLLIYQQADGWRTNAAGVLKRMRDGNRTSGDLRRPQEPRE